MSDVIAQPRTSGLPPTIRTSFKLNPSGADGGAGAGGGVGSGSGAGGGGGGVGAAGDGRGSGSLPCPGPRQGVPGEGNGSVEPLSPTLPFAVRANVQPAGKSDPVP